MSDKSLAEILETKKAKATRRARTAPPSGMEDTLKVDAATGGGEVSTNVPADEEPSWDDVILELGGDPELHQVAGVVEVRVWDMAVGGGEVRKMRYVKARLEPREVSPEDKADIEELVELIHSYPRPPHRRLSGSGSAILPLADPQFGKSEGGGTEATIKRATSVVDQWIDWAVVKGIHSAYLILMGDMVEGCFGHYSANEFSVDLNLREQKRVARHIIMETIDKLARRFQEVVVSTVASNHGENRKGYDLVTDDSDSMDLELLENMVEVYERAPGFDHVHFYFPEDPLVGTIDIEGVPVGWIHGHQITRLKAKPLYGADEWWAGQMRGRTAVGDCDVLLVGHFHHHARLSQQSTDLILLPSLDGGSRWFTKSKGVWSDPGLLGVLIDERGVRETILIEPEEA